MTDTELAQNLLPLIAAVARGDKIQCQQDGRWRDATLDNVWWSFNHSPIPYRVKPREYWLVKKPGLRGPAEQFLVYEEDPPIAAIHVREVT